VVTCSEKLPRLTGVEYLTRTTKYINKYAYALPEFEPETLYICTILFPTP